jgi:hypothetical protein
MRKEHFMADTDENEADVGRHANDLRHVDDTLAFVDSRSPLKLIRTTQLKWVDRVEQRTTEPGQFFVTRNHEVIESWAVQLHGKPAMLKSRAGGDATEMLRFQVTDRRQSEYDLVSWNEWFQVFDRADLVFIFQERADDGSVSDLFRLLPASELNTTPR